MRSGHNRQVREESAKHTKKAEDLERWAGKSSRIFTRRARLHQNDTTSAGRTRLLPGVAASQKSQQFRSQYDVAKHRLCPRTATP